MKFGFLTSLLLLLAVPAWALKEARLLRQSRTGQTALFNLGIHDGVAEGDYAVIVKELRSPNTRDLRLIPAAKARNIKISPDSSVWIIYRIFDAELLLTGEKYLILSESELLSGRRDPRLGRITTVGGPEAAKNTLTDDKDRISKLKDEFPAITPVHAKEYRSDKDIDLIDVEDWKTVGQSKHRTALYKSPSEKDFRREHRVATFEKLVTAYLKKVNDPEFNYDSFYAEQAKVEYANEFRKHANQTSEYDEFLLSQSRKVSEDAKLFRTILEKGERWSEDYSDEELRIILQNVSVLQEKDRRVFVQANPNRYTLTLNYGLNFTDPQNGDGSYRRSRLYSMELNFEAVPFIRHETLERFTLFGAFRSNYTATTFQSTNADVNETSIAGGVNWYPTYAPYQIEAPVIFIGTFFRTGYANAAAPSKGDKANYTMYSFPGFWAGLRYNFRSNVGVRIFGSLETLRLDQYQVKQTNSVLPTQANLVDGKMGFGLAYSF